MPYCDSRKGTAQAASPLLFGAGKVIVVRSNSLCRWRQRLALLRRNGALPRSSRVDQVTPQPHQ